MRNFINDSQISSVDQTWIQNCRRKVQDKILAGANLSPKEKRDLENCYLKSIHHSGLEGGIDVGQAKLSGSLIEFNLRRLRDTGELEMMHCAGFWNPSRLTSDRPHDNGPYFGPPRSARNFVSEETNQL